MPELGPFRNPAGRTCRRLESFAFVKETVSNQRPLLLLMPNLHLTDLGMVVNTYLNESESILHSGARQQRGTGSCCSDVVTKHNNGRLNCDGTNSN